MFLVKKKEKTAMPLQTSRGIRGTFNVHYPRNKVSGGVYAYLCRDALPKECDGVPGSSSCRAFRLYPGGEIRDFNNRVVREAGSSHRDKIIINKSYHQCRCRSPL
ncbi:MAG: hypothetical protein A3H02_00355 [Candidatus Niyogibacteria bacterium RIFCSPLOWO2_12_FULL_41_13]|uniref:Uncharacterized protein n=1 Tax=Candidatus Niyogibacteria bacterium RIFCSPLOWO2_12_FULL_41_13 TaxID=1801726 RepID=A0A1G2F1G2_9BACT|nr:MAG: hypothetical protein A3H02_00355 [Candidatus Niyogibacteria bacterium RIFCSPLOWO2_12_FULL_41_13]